MSFVKIRKSDMLVVELNTTAQTPDVNEFLEVESAFAFTDNHDYRYNEVDSTFYDVGTKAELIEPTVQAVQSSPFADTDGFFFRGKGYSGLATAGTTTTIDWEITEERWTNGIHIFLKDQVFEDTFNIKVVDTTYTYAGVLYDATYDPEGANLAWSVAQPNGVELQPFITDWNVCDDMQSQKPLKSDYPARIFAGLFLRCEYTSTGPSDVKIGMNGLLHYKEDS